MGGGGWEKGGRAGVRKAGGVMVVFSSEGMKSCDVSSIKHNSNKLVALQGIQMMLYEYQMKHTSLPLSARSAMRL